MPPAPKSRPPVPAIRSVLVTTDFSDLANRAIPYACALLPQGGRLFLLNVQHPRALPHGEYHLDPWTPQAVAGHARLLEQCRRRLERLVPAAAKARGIAVQVSVVAGRHVPAAICAEAKNLGVDAVCIASHGYTGLKAGLLGSVARAVLARCTRPVLVVRDRD